MRNFQDAKIYKIVCDITGVIYIGSTTQKLLSQRLSTHNSRYRGWVKNNKLPYCSSYKVLQSGKYHIELMEQYPCSVKEELTAQEGYHQSQFPCVNMRRAGLNSKYKGRYQAYQDAYRLNKKLKLINAENDLEII